MKFGKNFDLRFTQYLRLLRFLSYRGNYQPAISFHTDITSDYHPARGMALFTAADGHYLRRHFRSYAISAAVHMPDSWIHVHVYNPVDGDFEAIQALRTELPTLRITHSSETFDPAMLQKRSRASAQQGWKSLYICTSRFIAAKQFQDRSGTSLLITDIDLLFNGDALARFGNGIDVAMFLRPTERNLCKRVLGGVVFVAGSSAGMQFLSKVASNISRFLAAGYYWFAFDQFALHRSLRKMQKRTVKLNFSQLDTRDMSFDFDLRSLILVPKGKTRDQEAFQALAASFDTGPSERDVLR